MIFEVTPKQVENLSSKRLVTLLRRLLYAEARLAEIDARAVSVPLQITIRDGGEDARISWQGGREKTDFLPSRFTIFQSKATKKAGKSVWKKEAWTKASRVHAPRKLNPAIKKLIQKKGSYVGFTTAPLVGNARDVCIQAIKDGIAEAGADSTELVAVDIYDANAIAAWINKHPAVALWLNEQLSGVSLGGFQTVEGWATREDFSVVPLVSDSAKRFEIRNAPILDDEEEFAGDKGLSSVQASERILNHLAHPRRAVRVLGPSGVGKTRFVFELIRSSNSILTEAAANSAIYCDFRAVGNQLVQLALRCAQLQAPVLLIVDECPPEIAKQMMESATSDGSNLRLLSIGIEAELVVHRDCKNFRIGPSDDALIEKLIHARLPTIKPAESEYIRSLCGGFPRIAVLATENMAKGADVIGSIGDVVEKILRGSGIADPDDVRALEILALFERVGVDEDVAGQLDFVASRLAGTTGDRMYEGLSRASENLIVERRGRFLLAQPEPIARYLALRRLKLLRVDTLVKFVNDASPELVGQMFQAWRMFDVSPTAVRVAEHLLSRSGKYGTRDALDSEHGAEAVDELVHVAPDIVTAAIDRIFRKASIDDLLNFKEGRRGIVRALEKLVFRRASFARAAQLVLRLAAAENEKQWSNNAAGLFVQIYQLQLGGTEVPPGERFVVLDEGLRSQDSRILSVCIDALEKTLESGRATRSGGAETIGSHPPLKDWQPKFWSEIFDYRRQGLRRLMKLQRDNPEFAKRCKSAIASNMRNLIHPDLFADLESAISEVITSDGVWPEGLKGVGQWLYFDSTRFPEDFKKRVRSLYDSLIPSDPTQQAILYTKFWSGELYDPDSVHSPNDRDFEYSIRKSQELAVLIAGDPAMTDKAVSSMVPEELQNSFVFARELATKVSAPMETFKSALAALAVSGTTKGIQFIRGLLSGIDKRSSDIANQCIQLALSQDLLKGQAVNLYSAVEVTSARIPAITASLRDGIISIRDFVHLSYGRGFEAISPEELEPVLSELYAAGTDGMWTALEVVSMYQHQRPTLDATVERFIKKIIVAPEIFGQVRQTARDAYLLEVNVTRLIKHSRLDETFALELADQIVRLCQVGDYVIHDNLEGPVRKIIEALLKKHPAQIWTTLARFFEISNPTEREFLGELVGPDRHGFDGVGNLAAGVLFQMDVSTMTTWAQSNPATRAAFLCAFFPVFEFKDDLIDGWHPAMLRLVNEFGAIEDFREALENRLEPKSWAGSLVPLIQRYLSPLKSLGSHPIPEVAQWSRDQVRNYEQRIAIERQRDAEDRA